MYTIGQMSTLFDTPVSTLRYYDKEGLFPQIKRSSGIRRFDDSEVEAMHVIACLKKSGLEIKDIKQFMEWATEGPATYTQRKELFEKQRQALEDEMAELNKHLAMAKFKCWYYEKALADGNEDALEAMLPDKLPPEIQALYDLAHS